MIKSLLIKNFQCHKRLLLEFDKGVNVIVGSSDAGKSAIVRAFNWLTTNRPAGDSFKTHGSDKTEVLVVVEDGTEIRRFKSHNANSYSINGTVLKAFGQDVPEDVKKALNLSELNVQNQMDPPFLLSISAGEVARTLNEIVKLDSIDNALANVGKKLRDINQNIDAETARQSMLETDAAQYDYLPQAEVELLELESLGNQINKNIINADRLGWLCQKYTTLQNQYEEFKNVVPAEQELIRLITLHSEVSQAEGRADKLAEMTAYFKTLRDRKAGYERSIEDLSRKFDKLMSTQCPLCGSKIKR